jgi:hypothetical protein
VANWPQVGKGILRKGTAPRGAVQATASQRSATADGGAGSALSVLQIAVLALTLLGTLYLIFSAIRAAAWALGGAVVRPATRAVRRRDGSPALRDAVRGDEAAALGREILVRQTPVQTPRLRVPRARRGSAFGARNDSARAGSVPSSRYRSERSDVSGWGIPQMDTSLRSISCIS